MSQPVQDIVEVLEVTHRIYSSLYSSRIDKCREIAIQKVAFRRQVQSDSIKRSIKRGLNLKKWSINEVDKILHEWINNPKSKLKGCLLKKSKDYSDRIAINSLPK